MEEKGGVLTENCRWVWLKSGELVELLLPNSIYKEYKYIII